MRSSFRVVCTRSWDLRIWPPVPTVVNTCRTSGVSSSTRSTSDTLFTVSSNAMPGGRSTITTNSPRSSFGTNSVPMSDSVERLATNTRSAAATTLKGCASAQRSTLKYWRSSRSYAWPQRSSSRPIRVRTRSSGGT